MSFAIEKINETERDITAARLLIAQLQKESKEWVPNSDIRLKVADALHEGCTYSHIDQCGYLYNKKGSSYYERASKIVKWCESNEIDVEFMLDKRNGLLKSMFK